MAAIYAGMRGDERVAVKLLHSHLAEDEHIRHMFLHEARLASRLAHPNVVRVIDHGEHPDHGTFIVMEYVEGGDLTALLKAAEKQGERLPPPLAARIVLDLCRGLAAAHSLTAEDGAQLHLIHRDVSPHNVLVGTDGVARLIDFGIAKSDERYTMTRPGQLKGKLAYMAPEQLAHEDELDGRLDIFAAGVVLWEALVTRRLFKGADEISIINKVLLSKIPAPSAIHPELSPLDAVVLRALAREREDRYASAGQFADALEEAMDDLGGIADRERVGEAVTRLLASEIAQKNEKIERWSMTPSGLPSRSSSGDSLGSTPVGQPPVRSPWLWVAVGALIIAAGATGAGIVWSSREPETRVVHGARDAEPVLVAAPAPRPPAAEPTPREEPEAAPQLPVHPPTRRRRPPTREAEASSPTPAPETGAPANDPRRGEPADDLIPNPYGD